MNTKIENQNQAFYITLIVVASMMFFLIGFMFFGEASSLGRVMLNGQPTIGSTVDYQKNEIEVLEQQMSEKHTQAFVISTDAVVAYFMDQMSD